MSAQISSADASLAPLPGLLPDLEALYEGPT